MILKSLSRRSGIKQLIAYLLQAKGTNIERGHAKVLLKHNLRSRTVDGWAKEFSNINALRLHKRKDNIAIRHSIISLSVHDKAHINDYVLKALARQYIALVGENNTFLCVRHCDKSHFHIHIVEGAVDMTGKSNRMSRSQFHKLKLEMDQFQMDRFGALINSLPQHGKSKNSGRTNGSQVIRLRGRVSQKETLLQSLDRVYARVKSLKAFLTELRSLGHQPYYRAGRLTGIKFEGQRKFRFRSLGYQDKVANLDAQQIKVEKALAELQGIRRRSQERGRSRGDDNERFR